MLDDRLDIASYARLMHDIGSFSAQALLDHDRAAVFVPSFAPSGQVRRILVVTVVDGSVVFDADADPEAIAGPHAYHLVLDRLDAAIADLGLFTPARRRFLASARTSLIGWDFFSGEQAATRMLNRSGGPITPDQARRYPWLKATWGSASLIFSLWYGEPTPRPDMERDLDDALPAWTGGKHPTLDGLPRSFTGYLPKRYAPMRRSLPGATGDPRDDAMLTIQLLRDIAAGSAPTSPRAYFA